MKNLNSQPSLFHRLCASFLVVVLFLSGTVFAHNLETNIWEDRRRKTSAASQLASLPQVRIFDSTLRHFQRSSPSLRLPVGLNDRSLIADLQKNGVIRDVKNGSGPFTVIYIQDVHGHAEAQRNIAGMILSVLARHPKATIGLEGASGPISLHAFRVSTPEINKQIGSFLLNTAIITGAEYAGFAAALTPRMIGIEDAPLYVENVEALRSALAGQASALDQKNADDRQLSERKRQEYSVALISLNAQREAYENGQEGLGTYLAALSRVQPGAVASFKNIDLFLKTWTLESTLDFDRAERERKEFFLHLVPALTKEQLDNLSARGLALRTGDLRYPDFYAFLKTLAAQSGLSLSSTPTFDRYVNYTLQADSIRAETLFSEIPVFEDRVWRALCTNSRQREIYEASVAAGLTGKLLKLKLTAEEWEQAKKRASTELQAFPSFAAFYRAAEARNAALASRFETVRVESPEKVSVVLAGGFHSAGLTALIARDATVITVSPKLSTENRSFDNEYLNVFTREKTPLEKIFEAPKISIVMTLATKSIRNTAGQILNGMSLVLVTLIDPLAEALGKLSAQTVASSARGPIYVSVTTNGGRMESDPKSPPLLEGVVTGEVKARVWATTEGKKLTKEQIMGRVWGTEYWHSLPTLTSAWAVAVFTRISGFSLTTQLLAALVAGLIGLIWAVRKIRDQHRVTHNVEGLRQVTPILIFYGIVSLVVFLAAYAATFNVTWLDPKIAILLAVGAGFLVYQGLHYGRNLKAINDSSIAPLATTGVHFIDVRNLRFGDVPAQAIENAFARPEALGGPQRRLLSEKWVGHDRVLTLYEVTEEGGRPAPYFRKEGKVDRPEAYQVFHMRRPEQHPFLPRELTEIFFGKALYDHVKRANLVGVLNNLIGRIRENRFLMISTDNDLQLLRLLAVIQHSVAFRWDEILRRKQGAVEDQTVPVKFPVGYDSDGNLVMKWLRDEDDRIMPLTRNMVRNTRDKWMLNAHSVHVIVVVEGEIVFKIRDKDTAGGDDQVDGAVGHTEVKEDGEPEMLEETAFRVLGEEFFRMTADQLKETKGKFLREAQKNGDLQLVRVGKPGMFANIRKLVIRPDGSIFTVPLGHEDDEDWSSQGSVVEVPFETADLCLAVMPRKLAEAGGSFRQKTFDEWLEEFRSGQIVLGPSAKNLFGLAKTLDPALPNVVRTKLMKLTETSGDVDFSFSLGGSNEFTVETHSRLHSEGKFSEVLQLIGNELGLKADGRGYFNFRECVKQRGFSGFIRNGRTTLELLPDGTLVIIDPRFGDDHVSRGDRTIFTRTRVKAQHKISEARSWAAFAIEQGLAKSASEPWASKLYAWIRGISVKDWDRRLEFRVLPRRYNLVREKYREFHERALREEQNAFEKLYNRVLKSVRHLQGKLGKQKVHIFVDQSTVLSILDLIFSENISWRKAVGAWLRDVRRRWWELKRFPGAENSPNASPAKNGHGFNDPVVFSSESGLAQSQVGEDPADARAHQVAVEVNKKLRGRVLSRVSRAYANSDLRQLPHFNLDGKRTSFEITDHSPNELPTLCRIGDRIFIFLPKHKFVDIGKVVHLFDKSGLIFFALPADLAGFLRHRKNPEEWDTETIGQEIDDIKKILGDIYVQNQANIIFTNADPYDRRIFSGTEYLSHLLDHQQDSADAIKEKELEVPSTPSIPELPAEMVVNAAPMDATKGLEDLPDARESLAYLDLLVNKPGFSAKVPLMPKPSIPKPPVEEMSVTAFGGYYFSLPSHKPTAEALRAFLRQIKFENHGEIFEFLMGGKPRLLSDLVKLLGLSNEETILDLAAEGFFLIDRQWRVQMAGETLTSTRGVDGREVFLFAKKHSFVRTQPGAAGFWKTWFGWTNLYWIGVVEGIILQAGFIRYVAVSWAQAPPIPLLLEAWLFLFISVYLIHFFTGVIRADGEVIHYDPYLSFQATLTAQWSFVPILGPFLHGWANTRAAARQADKSDDITAFVDRNFVLSPADRRRVDEIVADIGPLQRDFSRGFDPNDIDMVMIGRRFVAQLEVMREEHAENGHSGRLKAMARNAAYLAGRLGTGFSMVWERMEETYGTNQPVLSLVMRWAYLSGRLGQRRRNFEMLLNHGANFLLRLARLRKPDAKIAHADDILRGAENDPDIEASLSFILNMAIKGKRPSGLIIRSILGENPDLLKGALKKRLIDFAEGHDKADVMRRYLDDQSGLGVIVVLPMDIIRVEDVVKAARQDPRWTHGSHPRLSIYSTMPEQFDMVSRITGIVYAILAGSKVIPVSILVEGARVIGKQA
ncbi:MAG: hypothetical protein ACKVQC_02800 [Elusimicrobiota bacterium]